MKTKIMELLAVLDEEAACYRDMQRVLGDEKASMSLSDRERFDQVQLEKEALVVNIQHAEKVRHRLIDHLGKAYQVNQSVLTVSKLGPFLPAPYNEKLLMRANRLRPLIADVQVKNEQNQQLIQHYLDLINGSLKLLTHLIYDHPVYQKPGSAHSAGGYAHRVGRFFCGTV